MKFYTLDTEFTWGRFKGKTIKDIVLDHQLYYIQWCIINLEHFYIAEDIIKQIKLLKPEFENLSNEAIKCLEEKYEKWYQQKILNTIKRDISRGHNSTNWNYYNDDLDMDQQDPRFWEF